MEKQILAKTKQIALDKSGEILKENLCETQTRQSTDLIYRFHLYVACLDTELMTAGVILI